MSVYAASGLLLLVACTIAGVVAPSSASFGQIVIIILLWALLIPFASRIYQTYRKQVAAAEPKISLWQAAMERWGKLYYCSRDDVVFIPGEGKSAPLVQMLEYIFETQSSA